MQRVKQAGFAIAHWLSFVHLAEIVPMVRSSYGVGGF